MGSVIEKGHTSHQHRSQSKMRLSGYGVELAVKSTEYKAMDDAQIKQGSVESCDIM